MLAFQHTRDFATVPISLEPGINGKGTAKPSHPFRLQVGRQHSTIILSSVTHSNRRPSSSCGVTVVSRRRGVH
jgi:hypothetical protein